MLGFIRKELDLSMAFCGCRDVRQVNRNILALAATDLQEDTFSTSKANPA